MNDELYYFCFYQYFLCADCFNESTIFLGNILLCVTIGVYFKLKSKCMINAVKYNSFY